MRIKNKGRNEIIKVKRNEKYFFIYEKVSQIVNKENFSK